MPSRTQAVIAGTLISLSTILVAAPPATLPSSLPATRPVDEFSLNRARVIRFLENRVKLDPDDITAQNRLAGDYLARFRDTGDDRDLSRALATAERSLKAVPAAQNAMALAARARVEFNFHRFADARADAEKLLTIEFQKRYPLEILGDALLELGDYDQAAETYKKMVAFGNSDPDTSTETRLARLVLIRGDLAEARKRFASAIELARPDAATSPDVLAWCLVQSGQLAFSTGDYDTAERCYLEALKARPTDWPAIDHLAELRAAQKRYDEAISLYEPLVARVPRPELMQSLGDVFQAAGKPDEAKRWHDRALEKYLAAAKEGSAHYYHHLAGFYCDTQPDAPEALKYAAKDLQVRHSVYAYDGMAWALYQAGDYKSAAEMIAKALATGTKDSHLLYHAALIHARAGDSAKGREYLKQAAEINPKMNEFHVHR